MDEKKKSDLSAAELSDSPGLDLRSLPPGVLDKHQTSGFWAWFWRSFNPFRIATLRGIGIVLPPLLTIIIFIWIWNTLDRAILTPIESVAHRTILYFVDETLNNDAVKKLAAEGKGRFDSYENERVYIDQRNVPFVQLKSKWIPYTVYDVARDHAASEPLVSSADYYSRYIQVTYLKRHLLIPAFLAMFVALLYLLGKLLAIGLGRMIYNYFERLVNRVPIIRNVYSSVKQVTDFAFSDKPEVQFNRVVAVEYPRREMWVLAFVTGEGMSELTKVVGEPMITVLVPTSPMPATGFSIMVPKSQTVDLEISIDQAIQYCVSCGVVVPAHQNPRKVIEGITQKVATGHERVAS
jgi:uncharacterized membrane protein